MKILVLLVGIFVGWTLAVIKPPPKWFSSRVERLLSLTQKTLHQQAKENFDSSAKKLEKKLK